MAIPLAASQSRTFCRDLPAFGVEARVRTGEQRSLEGIAATIGGVGINAQLQQLQDAVRIVDLCGYVQQRVAHRIGAADIGAGFHQQVELRIATALHRTEDRGPAGAGADHVYRRAMSDQHL